MIRYKLSPGAGLLAMIFAFTLMFALMALFFYLHYSVLDWLLEDKKLALLGAYVIICSGVVSRRSSS